MARPQKTATLTSQQIEELASIGCSDEEIAVLTGLEETTLQKSFSAQLKSGRSNLRERLRRRQIVKAEDGDTTMLIWLGKVYLKQREHVEQTNYNVDVSQLTDEQLDAIIAGKSTR